MTQNTGTQAHKTAHGGQGMKLVATIKPLRIPQPIGEKKFFASKTSLPETDPLWKNANKWNVNHFGDVLF